MRPVQIRTRIFVADRRAAVISAAQPGGNFSTCGGKDSSTQTTPAHGVVHSEDGSAPSCEA